MMAFFPVKYSGGKIVPQSDLRVGTTGKGTSVRKDRCRIGTWNVRSLGVSGKLENAKMEMERLRIDILGVCEIKWTGADDYWSDGYRVIYSGDDRRIAGVGIILKKEWGRRVKSVWQYNERILMVKLEGEPTDTVIVQVYMPTSTHTEEEIDEVYEQIEEVLGEVKGKENLIIMGDWNAVVGEGKEGPSVGNFGLGKRNAKGERLVEFCNEKNMVVANTLFEQHRRRRYTWKMPGDIARYQIDYILVRERYKNQVKQCKSYPGADINSDHNLVLMESLLRYKKIKKTKQEPRWDSKMLAKEENREKFATAVDKKLGKGGVMATEERWDELKRTIKEVAEEQLVSKRAETKKPWITTEIRELIEERRKYKNARNDDEVSLYKKLKNQVNRECKKARENWIENCCEEINENMKKGNTETAYKLVKKHFGERKTKSSNIRDANGNILIEGEDIGNRWRQYIEELYQGPRPLEENLMKGESEVDEEERGPHILRSEFDRAVEDLKKNKAPGEDKINGDIIKALGNKAKDMLYGIIKDCYQNGRLPEDFQRSVMIAIPKKTRTEKCEEHRTLSLVSHASKILTRIISRRMERKIEDNLSENQFGFRKNRGTREAILCLRVMVEKTIHVNKPLYVAFVDLEKAFDNVEWNKMFRLLEKLGMDYNDRRIIYQLYKKQVVTMRMRDGRHIEAQINKGVRQGCNLSPALFNIYMEEAIREAQEIGLNGIKINGDEINMLRFADDIAIIAENQDDLQRSINAMDQALQEYNMNINKTKTKILVCGREKLNAVVTMRGQKLEQVDSFTYLGSTITWDGRSTTDIKRRIAQAKKAFMMKRQLLCSKKIGQQTRKQYVKSFVWSVALYGSEAWTIGKVDQKRLEAFETWCWRRMLKIKWTDKIRNEEVYRRVEEKRTLWNTIEKRRTRWIGHTLRHNGFVKNIIEGKIEGKVPRGRPRDKYIGQIKKKVQRKRYQEVSQLALDREGWRAAVNQSKD